MAAQDVSGGTGTGAIDLAERWRVAGRRLKVRDPEAFARHVEAMEAIVAGWAADEVRTDDELL